MIWLRKGIVHLLALVLLVTLLGMATVAAINHDFTNPNKLEGWLTESKIYSQVIPNALSNAQVASSQDGSEGSISLNDPGVRRAADQAFPPTLLQQSVSTFLAGNYAWLKGRTATPVFKIDLSGAKQNFANQIGQLVESHLASLPSCSVAQLSQLQLPVDPLTVSCQPLTLNPKTEGAEVEQAILNTGDFLNKPVITAANISHRDPYYQKVSKGPQFFRLAQKLPYILAVVALIAALSIIAIAPKRRKGLRRVGATLLLAGIILVAIKFVADKLVSKVESHVLANTLNNQLKQPYHDVLHSIVSSLAQTEFWFGVVFLALAVVIFGYLILTRSRSGQPKSSPTPGPAETADKTALEAADIQLAARRPQPNLDITSPQPPRPAGPTITAPPLKPQKPRPPKRPRLIQ